MDEHYVYLWTHKLCEFSDHPLFAQIMRFMIYLCVFLFDNRGE